VSRCPCNHCARAPGPCDVHGRLESADEESALRKVIGARRVDISAFWAGNSLAPVLWRTCLPGLRIFLPAALGSKGVRITSTAARDLSASGALALRHALATVVGHLTTVAGARSPLRLCATSNPSSADLAPPDAAQLLAVALPIFSRAIHELGHRLVGLALGLFAATLSGVTLRNDSPTSLHSWVF